MNRYHNLDPHGVIARYTYRRRWQMPKIPPANTDSSPFTTFTVYVPFVPDEVIIYPVYFSATNSAIPGSCLVMSNFLDNYTDGLLSVALAGRDLAPLIIRFNRNNAPMINNTYTLTLTDGNYTPLVLTNQNAFIMLHIEFIRYETPGMPRE